MIKKVCRQLGIDKWPFKGNKITLRKQGLCHSRKKAGRAQSPDAEMPRPSESGDGLCAGMADMHHAQRGAYQPPQQQRAMGHPMMDHGALMDQAQAQAPMRLKVPPAGYRQSGGGGVDKKAAAVDYKEHQDYKQQIHREMHMRRAQPALDLRMPGSLLGGAGAMGSMGGMGGMGGGGGSASHGMAGSAVLYPGLMQRAAMLSASGEHARNTGFLSGSSAPVFAWESRAILPGAADQRALLGGGQAQRDGRFDHAPASRAHVAAGSSARCLSPAGPDVARSFGGDMDPLCAGGMTHLRHLSDTKPLADSKMPPHFCDSKLSPGSDSPESKRDSACEHDMAAGLEDDAEGFDLSWLVPSEHLRSMPDIEHSRAMGDLDADLLERLRTPVQYADN